MRTGLALMIALTSACVHGRGAGTMASDGAGVVVPEVTFHNDRLYVTTTGATEGAMIRVSVDGHVLAEMAAPRAGCRAYVGTELNRACSLPIAETAVSERPLAIEVISRGGKVSREMVSLVALPAAGGRKLTAIDPLARIARPYTLDHKVVMWLPIDARFEGRDVQVYLLEQSGVVATRYMAKRLSARRVAKPGDPVVTVAPVVLDGKKFAGGGEFASAATISIYVGEHRIGDWRVNNAIATGGFAWLEPVELTYTQAAAIERKMVSVVTRSTVEYGRTVRSPIYRRLLVPRVCAVIASEPAAKLAAELDVERLGRTTVRSTEASYEPTTNVGASVWDTGQTPVGVKKEEPAAYARKLKKLDALATRSDCGVELRQLMPWLLPEPGAREVNSDY